VSKCIPNGGVWWWINALGLAGAAVGGVLMISFASVPGAFLLVGGIAVACVASVLGSFPDGLR
jgi:hypothetical protein